MPVAGVASARARLFEEGFGGVFLEDDEDYTEQARVPGIVVKLRKNPSAKVVRVPLPERFRCNGHRRFSQSSKQEINGEIVELGEEANVEGRPSGRPRSSTRPRQPMPAGAQRPAGASSRPVEVRQSTGSMIGDNGVCMGKPARTMHHLGPFHEYLSDSMGKEVTAIYYKRRCELETHLERNRNSRRLSGSSSSSGRTAGPECMAHTEKLEEGPEGIDQYPFIPGMQIFVDVEGDPEGPPTRSSRCTLM